MTDWTNVVGAVGGISGPAIAGAVAIWTVRRAKRQDAAQAATEETARESVAISRESAAIARRAAEASQRSADEAARIAAVQVAARHDSLAPAQRTLPTELADNPQRAHRDLFGTLVVSRDYRVRAVAVAGKATWSLGLDSLLRANQVHRFPIEKWPPDRTVPQAEAVLLKLWPPAADDPVETWTCDCGRPLTEGRSGDAGHWEIRMPILPPKPQQPFFVDFR